MSVTAPAVLYESSPTSVASGQQRQVQGTADGKVVISGTITSTPATVGAGVDTNAARVVEASADASTDRSGTITLGGTAQNAMAANTSRRFWALTNNSDTVMMVRVGGTASATAGVKVNTDDLVYGEEIDAISVFCATTGKVFTAWEY